MMGFTRGGGEIWDLEMASHLRDLGVEVTFVIATPLRGSVPTPVESFPTVDVPVPHLQEHALAAPRGIGGVLADIDANVFARRVAATLDDRSTFDLLHVNSLPEFAPFIERFDQPVTTKLNGPPHSLWYDRLHPWRSSYDLLEQFVAIVTTGMTTEVVESSTAHDRIVPINPGVDTEHFTPGDGRAEGEGPFRLLFVGRFVPAKHLQLLIDAVATLADRWDIELQLVGDGPLRETIQGRIEHHDLADTVKLVGYVDNRELPSYYREADLFVLSSRTDNCPITIMEAMSCGTPVVAPQLGWIPHLVEDGVTGCLYDTGDEAALVAGIETLLANSTTRREMANQARDTAVDQFDWSQRASRLRELFETVHSDS